MNILTNNFRWFTMLMLSLQLIGIHAIAKGHRQPANRATLSSPALDNYDIKHLTFKLHMSDTSVYVKGDVTTTAQVTASSLSSYVFELDSSLNVDSVKINGALMSCTHVAKLCTVNITTPLASGAMFNAEVFYHGLPPGGSGGFFNGITHALYAGSVHVVYTISDPWVALNWWPCKQSILDKIDSVDMFVSVPRGVVDGSNGLLVNVDTTSVSGEWTYHWKTNYPIDYYLISIAIAKYAEYKTYAHFTGSTDSMLVQNFFMDTAHFNPMYKPNFDSIPLMIDYFSTVFGRYPFWREKYGVCYATLPGGMEHQTMTTIGNPNTYIIAHELTHQWFGDHVTYSTWKDVWLSEGFATFAEQLYLGHFWSPSAALGHRSIYLGYITSNPCGMVSVTDTSTSDSLFEATTVYAKGAGVVRALQYIAPSDSVFFEVLKQYQSTYAFGNANTAQFKAIAESLYGFSLDSFFTQWIYGRGYPMYRVTWNQSGSTVYMKLIQSASCPSHTPHFNTPLEVKLHNATSDTVFQIYNSLDTQLYVFNWSQTATNVYINFDIWTICKVISQVHDVKLGTEMPWLGNVVVAPNPAVDSWRVDGIPAKTELTLQNIAGQTVWTGASDGATTRIPCSSLHTGTYILQMRTDEGGANIKLSR